MSATTMSAWYIGHVREVALADHVADRPHAGRGAHALVDRHRGLGLVDPDAADTDRGQVSAPSGGHQQPWIR